MGLGMGDNTVRYWARDGWEVLAVFLRFSVLNASAGFAPPASVYPKINDWENRYFIIVHDIAEEKYGRRAMQPAPVLLIKKKLAGQRGEKMFFYSKRHPPLWGKWRSGRRRSTDCALARHAWRRRRKRDLRFAIIRFATISEVRLAHVHASLSQKSAEGEGYDQGYGKPSKRNPTDCHQIHVISLSIFKTNVGSIKLPSHCNRVFPMGAQMWLISDEWSPAVDNLACQT
jgi:hypothetical protein